MKALKGIRGRNVVAVCDLVPGRARAFADRWGVQQSYTSLSDMLAQVGLGSVHVLLPPDLHFAPAMEILAAGVRVVLEKPACVTADECERLLAAAPSPDRVSVSHNFLFSPHYVALRNAFRAGTFGPVSEIDIVWNKELGQFRGGPFGGWLFAHPGNVILEVGPHSLSHLFDLMPDATIRSVSTDRPYVVPGGLEVPRRWAVEARSGSTAIRLNWSLGAGFTEHRIHVRGLFGSATVDFDAGTYVERLHSPLPDDFDRYRITRREGAGLRGQSRDRIRRYILSKFKLSKFGNDFGESISLSLAACGRSPQDSRVSLALATQTIAACEAIVRMGVPEVRRHEIPSHISPASENRPPILVLGGTGFIGRALVRKLCEAGERVRLLVRDPRGLSDELRAMPLEVVRGSIGSANDVRTALEGVKVVYHLARANVKTWKDYQDREIGDTRVVAEECLKAGVERLIYTGTIDSYYAGDPGETIRDDSPLDTEIVGRNLYARAKAESEAMLMDMHRDRGLPVTILRPGIVIGSGGSPFHWGIGMWNGMGVCRMWGQGSHTLPLVLVDDCADALVSARSAEGIVGRSLNLVGPGLLTAREYLDEVESQGRLKLDRRPRSVARYYLFDMAKWLVKLVVRHPERRRPTYRDWNSRTQAARFDCSQARTALNWNPTGDRATLVEEGIAKPVREWLA